MNFKFSGKIWNFFPLKLFYEFYSQFFPKFLKIRRKNIRNFSQKLPFYHRDISQHSNVRTALFLSTAVSRPDPIQVFFFSAPSQFFCYRITRLLVSPEAVNLPEIFEPCPGRFCFCCHEFGDENILKGPGFSVWAHDSNGTTGPNSPLSRLRNTWTFLLLGHVHACSVDSILFDADEKWILFDFNFRLNLIEARKKFMLRKFLLLNVSISLFSSSLVSILSPLTNFCPYL